jgi:hypothetical protein
MTDEILRRRVAELERQQQDALERLAAAMAGLAAIVLLIRRAAQ